MGWRLFVAVLVCAIATRDAGAQESWPQFRGPTADGVAGAEELALEWTDQQNVIWATDLAGNGWSSPIVWGSRIFLTAAVSLGDFKEPSPGIYGNDYARELMEAGHSREEVSRRVRERDTEASEEVPEGVRWMVIGLDAETGEPLWQRQVHEGIPFGGRHRKNTYASETPVTDGEAVYAYFGNIGVFALTLDGEPIWERRLDPHPTYLDFGTSSSPVLVDDLLLIQNDNEESSYLLALDKRTGEEVWRVERGVENRLIHTSFSTPFVWRNSGRTEIVTAAPRTLVSYDTQGKELWRLVGISNVAAPTPVAQGDTLFLGSGSPSESVRPIFAIRAGGKGEISLAEGESENDFVAWYLETGGSYITSQVLYDSRLYVLYDKGFMAAYDTEDGRQVYRVRIGRGGNTFSSSPWVQDGRIYCLSETGETFVVRAGDEFEIIARNDLDEMSLATPAIANGSLFIRTASRLFRIEQAREEAP
jgi:outer membrane protein assembly factor BamB